MNIAAMARKFLALILMLISWSLAGFDVLEDPSRFQLHCSGARLVDHGQTLKPTKDFTDSAGHLRISSTRVIEQRPMPLLLDSTTPWQKLDKVHNSTIFVRVSELCSDEF